MVREARDAKGQSALLVAAMRQEIGIIKLLLAYGGDLSGPGAKLIESGEPASGSEDSTVAQFTRKFDLGYRTSDAVRE